MIIKVSAVSFFNSAPFVYGLTRGIVSSKVRLSLDHPAECAAKLMEGRVDIGLVPVAVVPQLKHCNLVSNYCIGSNGGVQTVALFSHVPLSGLDTIIVDTQSRTSSVLVRVLAKHLWNQSFIWRASEVKSYYRHVKPNEGLVAIGDKVFEIESSFAFSYDLASQWKSLTGLPFVFATWVANKNLPSDFIQEFNQSLSFGLNSIPEVVEGFAPSVYTHPKAINYLSNSISYNLNDEKKEAMELFWKLSKDV